MAPRERLSIVLAFALTGLSTIVVALRFYSRRFLVGRLDSSDWVMLLALLATWASSVITLYLCHSVDYSHIHEQESSDKVASGNLLLFWIYRLSYILDLCLIKTSILIFFSHVAESHKIFHRAVRVLLAVILLGGASMIFATIFTCYPIADAWSLDVFVSQVNYGTHPAQCYDPTTFWLFNSTYNMVTDIVIWSLPIVFFLNLQRMPLRRRLELVAIFSVGIVAIFASAWRIRITVLWITPEHLIEETANLLLWGHVEQHTGIMAASLPFLWPLFRKAVRRVRGRDQLSPGPVLQLADESPTGGSPVVFRPPIIPSPTPTIGSSCKEFQLPKENLVPIEPIRTNCTWGTAIWDGTQVRQVLPT